MSGNKKGTNAQIELVSNSGPLPINVMMQEGVKALTKILSNQLQDRKAFENAQHSMQFVIRNNGKQSGSGSGNVVQGLDPALVLDEEGTNGGRNKNKNKYSKHSSTMSKTEIHDFMDEDFLNPDLQLDGEEAEIIFDYETQDDSPDAIGKRISEMIESVLPDGFATDAQGQLHAVINGNELNITELDNRIPNQQGGKFEYLNDQNGVPRHNKIEEIVNDGNQYEINSSINLNALGEDDEDDNDEDADAYIDDEDIGEDPFDHESCCPHHGPGAHHKNPQRFKNYNYHDFEYPIRNVEPTKRRPDFSVLIDEEKPMCMFCEYYMVFGEPPKNMIKWYNNMFGYNRLPPSSNRDRHRHNHHHQEGQRKRNR
ncbi:protein Ibd2p [Monosporozyma unispora]|nr:inhibition of bud division 2 [Kazachstania unispora]